MCFLIFIVSDHAQTASECEVKKCQINTFIVQLKTETLLLEYPFCMSYVKYELS